MKFLESKDHRILEDHKKTFNVHQVEKDGRDIFGKFKSGEYDIMADFFNIEEEKLKENARTLSDSEVYPYFFHINIPKNNNRAILILQTFSIHAIKTVLEFALNSFLKELNDPEKYDDKELLRFKGISNYTVEIKPLISGKLLEKLQSADGVYTIKMFRNKISKNSAKRLYNAKTGKKQLMGDPTNIKETHIYSIRSKKKGLFDKENIMDAIANVKTNYAEIFEEDYDQISIVVDIDGAEHSLVFGKKTNGYKEVFPLDEEKIPLENGFPEYNFMKKTAKGYLKYLTQ